MQDLLDTGYKIQNRCRIQYTEYKKRIHDTVYMIHDICILNPRYMIQKQDIGYKKKRQNRPYKKKKYVSDFIDFFTSTSLLLRNFKYFLKSKKNSFKIIIFSECEKIYFAKSDKY